MTANPLCAAPEPPRPGGTSPLAGTSPPAGTSTRRTFLAVVGGLAGAAAAGAALGPRVWRADAAGAPSGKLRVIAFNRPLPFLAAEHQGFLAREGLEVTWEITRGSEEQIRGLLAGRWDIAHTAADNVMAYVDREGADLFVFLVATLGLDQNLVVLPEIETYAQLRGKPLGVDAVDTGYAFVLRKMLANAGVAAGDYQLVPFGGTQQRLDALAARRAAGCLLSGAFETAALQKGFRLLDKSSRHFPLYPSVTAATTRRWARAHETQLAGYTRALWAGAAWGANPANKDAAVEIIARDRSVDGEAARRLFEVDAEYRTRVTPTAEEVLAALDVVRRLRVEMTGVGRDLTAYFDDRYMRQARRTGP